MLRHSPARRGLLALALATACGAAMADPSAAPATPGWPTRPLRIIVGFPPGSSPDLTARTFAEPLAQALGQPVIVDNKVGAGGNIGADAVAKARDGHTIGLFINGNLTIARLLNPQVPYDPANDLAPLSLIGVSPLVLAAPVGKADLPIDARTFLQAARQAGARWSYGTPGVGTVGHLGTELLKARSGMAPVHIPYPGYPQVATAMLGGQLQLALLPPALALAQERAGKLRLIGVTSAGRSALVPGVPSLSEAGVRDFELEIWNAFAAPATMPAPVRARLSSLIGEIARSPEVRAKLFQQGWQAVGSSAEGLANRMRTDTAMMARLIREQRIRAE
ncbi:MAG: tripartite tricarboxylate transporter substrate binding protein [Proteobacteria bacterium]|nr:tripartite tricarboxylate transporter substrate binding protein [Pseudomonadota bacterium]